MNELKRLYAANPEPAGFAAAYFRHLNMLFDAIDKDAIARFIELLEDARQRGATVFFCGNGGSAATASHFQNDLTRWRTDPMRVVSLTDNTPVITALANDYGYEYVFTMQLEPLLRSGDIVVAISASGNSPNVVSAIRFANERGATTVALTGFDGGIIGREAHLRIHVQTDDGEYGPVEDVHMILDHLVMSYTWQKWSAEHGGSS